MQSSSSSRLESSINVTPLVDVCLVLLIIFMVMTPMISGLVPVQLPKTASPSRTGNSNELLQITIKDDGTTLVGGNVVRIEEIRSAVEREFAARGATARVAVRADRTLKYGDVVRVLDVCRGAGFKEVGLVTEKENEA